jgi:hypothetical protein
MDTKKNIDILKNFDIDFLEYMHSVAALHNVSVTGRTASTVFRDLILELFCEASPIVVLIDEYDFSIFELMLYPDIQNSIRNTMKNFYMQIKLYDENIYFSFITVILKFSSVGISSAINNFTDISIDREYAAMFGYTTKEIYKNLWGN